MLTHEIILRLIRDSLGDVNADRDADTKIPFVPDLALYGENSPLDSLDFVNFTAGLEERLQREAGVTINLASILFDDDAGQPFRSVQALADYLVSSTGRAAE